MRRILAISLAVLLLLVSPVYAVDTDVDADSNDKLDVAYGGTNAATEQDPTVDTSAEIQAIIGAGVYEIPWGTVTTRDADATPEVEDRGIYSITNTGALTITDFVDSDGDHSAFAQGDQIILVNSDADITIDCSENANLECFGGNDFTASATQITSHHFTFDGTRWVGPTVPMSSPTTLALKTVQAGLNVITDNDGRVLTIAELNSVIRTSGAADYDIPSGSCDEASEIGTWVTLKATAAVAPSLTSLDASDVITLADGTALTAGDELDLGGAAGNQCTVICVATNLWEVIGEIGTCVDGGAAD